MVAVQKILVPVDFSECSRHALEYAYAFAERFGAAITVLHAWTLPISLAPYGGVRVRGEEREQTLEGLAEAEARRHMASFLGSLTAPAGLALDSRIVFGFEADSIVLASKDHDLVVMGTHGRTGLSHVLLGSIAEKVVRLSSCPVLTVRSPAP